MKNITNINSEIGRHDDPGWLFANDELFLLTSSSSDTRKSGRNRRSPTVSEDR